MFGAKDSGGGSIVDDFAYGSNVATCHVEVRLGFLRKVYGILSAQLLVTTVVTAGLMYVDRIGMGLGSFLQENQWVLLVMIGALFAVMFALMAKRKETPTNYILLGIFTVLEALFVGVVAARYEAPSVLQAAGLTLSVTAALTVYTLQSKRDFSAWGAGLFACLWILICGSFLQLFLQSALMDTVLGGLGATLFSLFIVYDTHLIMHKLSAEEYMLGAINLYLDILNLFLEILRLMGKRNQ